VRKLRKALVFAYACDPVHGSEPAAGWGIVRALSAIVNCVVLVGPEHEPALNRWRSEHPEDDTTFVVVQEPGWARWVPRTRVGRFLIYLGWLPRAAAIARSLDLAQFDLAWHATYSAYWLPTPATALGIPCVWGPVGGGVMAPRSLWPLLGLNGALCELTDWIAVLLMARLRSTRRTWRRVAVALVQNEATLARLPAGLRDRSVVLNHASLVEAAAAAERTAAGPIVFGGRLESRKAPSLVIRALARTPRQVRLMILGDGPQRRRLENLAVRLGVDDRVVFAGNVPRDVMMNAWRTAAAAVFAGVREEGGVALAEAMLLGTPAIVLAHGGARTVAALASDRSRVALIEPTDASTVIEEFAGAMTRFVAMSSSSATPLFQRQRATARLEGIVARAVREQPASGADPCGHPAEVLPVGR